MKTKLSYSQALEIARGAVADLLPYCERIEIAGSVRRQKPEVGDLEIVCIPRIVMGRDLLGFEGTPINLLSQQLATYHVLKGGEKYKQIQLASICMDVYITTPEQWGCIYTVRTGSAEFTHWLVTPRRYGGAMPGHLKMSEGRLWCGGKALETPDEASVFAAIGLEWIEPQERSGPRMDAVRRDG